MTIGAVAIASAPIAGATYAAPAVTALTMPTVAVELSMAPPADDPVWVDLAADMQRVRTRRGRQRELDRYQAGTFTVTLENSGAEYDPSNGASPYAGHVKPMRRLRVRATYAGVTYPVIDGYIDSVDLEYEGPNVARAVISATDAFKVLAGTELPVSAYAAEVLADGPVAWWRFDEFDGDVAYDAVGTVDLDEVVGTPTLGAATLISRDPGAAAEFTNADQGFAAEISGFPLTGPPFTVEAVIDGAGANANVLWLQTGAGDAIWLGALFGGYFTVSVAGVNGFVSRVFGGPSFGDPGTHHVAGVMGAAGDLHLYIDGVEVTDTPGSAPAAPFAGTFNIASIGEPPAVLDDAGLGIAGWVGRVDEVAVYASALSPTRIAAHAEAVATPWNNDLPGARMERVLGLAPWPDDRADLAAGVTVLQSATLGGTLLEHLQKVAESEFGALFVDAAGVLRFVNRHALRNRPELHTLSDDPVAAGALPYRAHPRILRPPHPKRGDRVPRRRRRADGTQRRVHRRIHGPLLRTRRAHP